MLNHLIEALTSFITNLYVSTGLVGIVLAMAIESCCIPLPSEIVMPLAGVLLAQDRLLTGMGLWPGLFLVSLAGSLGCLLGSVVAYGIGAAGGRPLLLKYGRYILISQHDADKADEFFRRWGSATTFFSRLLPVVRTYISFPAGIARMPFVRFCLYTFLGSFPWCLLLAYVGTVVGNNLETLGPIFHSLDVVIIVGLLVLVVLYVWRHIRNDRRARAALAMEQAQTAPMAQVQPVRPSSQASVAWGQSPSSQSSLPPQPSQVPWQPPSSGGQSQSWGRDGQNGPTVPRR